MLKLISTLVALLGLVGCSSNNVMAQFEMGSSVQSVKKQQILDPVAPQRNDGKIEDLDGENAALVMENYHKSASPPASARGKLDELVSGSSGN